MRRRSLTNNPSSVTHQCLECRIDIVRRTDLAHDKIEAERPGGDLDVSRVDRVRLITDIDQHADLSRGRHDFERKFQLLCGRTVR